MDVKTFMLLILVSLAACTSKIHSGLILNGKVYESNRGPLFGGNKFIFNLDNSFIYVAHGPAIFLSKGTWNYDNTAKEVILQSVKPEEKFINPKTVDTLWVDLSQKRIKIVSKKKLRFEDIEYYLR